MPMPVWVMMSHVKYHCFGPVSVLPGKLSLHGDAGYGKLVPGFKNLAYSYR